MTKENEQEPKNYKKGDQIWYIDLSHCPYEGECPVSPPCVKSVSVVSVIQDGLYYGKSGGGIISAKDMYSTPEAAEASILDAVSGKVKALRRRVVELEAALETAADDSGRKWCPLLDTASCYRDCGWYDAARKECGMLSIPAMRDELSDITKSLLSIAGSVAALR